MKTMTKKNLVGAGMAIAMAFAAWLPTTARAQDETKPMKPMKGGEHQMMLNKIDTKEQAEAVKPDDTFAMVCGKCKTVYVTRVKTSILKHTCSKCGDDSGFCCATKPGDATKGMEKEKK